MTLRKEGDVRIPSGCAISGIMDRSGGRHDGTDVLKSISLMHDRGNGLGGGFAAYGIYPDFAVALDVNHAKTPGSPDLESFDMGSPLATMGPYIHPMLRRKLAEIAKEHNITLQSAVAPRYTSTDADDIGLARDGVPSVLLELPIKYMHTSVETFDMHTLTECARLLTAYCAAIDDSWRDELWN